MFVGGDSMTKRIKEEWTIIDHLRSTDLMVNLGTYTSYIAALGRGFDELMDFGFEGGEDNYYITPVYFLEGGENRVITLMKKNDEGEDIPLEDIWFLRKEALDIL